MMYVRFPFSLRDVEDLLHEREIEVSREAVRFGAALTAQPVWQLRDDGDDLIATQLLAKDCKP